MSTCTLHNMLLSIEYDVCEERMLLPLEKAKNDVFNLLPENVNMLVFFMQKTWTSTVLLYLSHDY